MRLRLLALVALGVAGGCSDLTGNGTDGGASTSLNDGGPWCSASSSGRSSPSSAGRRGGSGCPGHSPAPWPSSSALARRSS
jgi:hypothetical protein